MASGDGPAKEISRQVDAVVLRFEEAWQNGGRPAIEDFLPKDGPARPAVLKELVHVDRERRRQVGESLRLEDYLQRFPELKADPPSMTGRTIIIPASPLEPVNAGPSALPEKIGRYRIERILGQGGFGLVYLAHDDQLFRLVAIKVPHPKLMVRPEDAEPYLAEARVVASLDYPNIVPVYDVGQTKEYPCFVVSKFIEGRTLSQRIKQDRLLVFEATELVATLAKTLHYAHRKGLVHRDIKPGNILLEERAEGEHPFVPFVADFGLALREKDFGKSTGIIGTPSYMSPEQARGEGHRVDGRSDIFSLGVVFYELLTGVRPFRADNREELLERIRNADVHPPRQCDDTLPRELERICLKALAQRASNRYTTAKDLADDLRLFLDHSTQEEKRVLLSQVPAAEAASPALSTPVGSLASGAQPIRVVPKGLRSFGTHDAEFYLELLPGPRDREGLPESLRFWKTRIEERDADNTFAVGLIYGPSGCGKSSLVKAGLLPRLHPEVIAVYVEATAEDTETRLLNGLRKHCPGLAANLPLKERLASLRRGQGIAEGQKVLIVLDHFEQWLHAKQQRENTELVEALRQCDGGRVQCIVMVRDDFWLAVSRFLNELEIRLLEGQNSAMLDLFGLEHARKVLAAFGRAFGRLPEITREMTLEQKQFLEQAVLGLAQEGKVICVRLALFAEMMKDKAWTPASLKAVGGAAGVGVTFLEETFSAAAAPPEHRRHQKAARGVLQALLPESGTPIKGHMRSHNELLTASGYQGRPQDFDDLRRILDRELRLISPTDPEGMEESGSQVQVGEKYYQLTHDYLVPALEDWLTRKQKETRRGRAALLLADRAAIWNTRAENRQLPTLLQWIQIRALTQKTRWTPPERKMMARATRYHGARIVAAAAVMLALSLLGWDIQGRIEAHNLRKRLLDAKTFRVLDIVNDMPAYRRWLDPLLADSLEQAQQENNPQAELRARLALLPTDPGQVGPLYERLLLADTQEVVVIREALQDHKQYLVDRLWALLKNPTADHGRRLRAACALSTFAPDDPRWENVRSDVAEILVLQDSFALAQWTEALKKVGKALLPPLARLLGEERRSPRERGLIARVYGSLAVDVPDAFAPLEDQLNLTGKPEDPENERVALAKRQAGIAAALLVMGRGEKVWPLLKRQPDPTCRSFLMEWLGPAGVDARVLISRLDSENKTSIRRALLLSLGVYGPERFTRTQQQALLTGALRIYRDDPDSGIHAAAGWLLHRPWGASEELGKIDQKLANGKQIEQRQWYVSSQNQTFVVLSQPHDFWMDEKKRRRWAKIDHDFAIAAKEVTVAQFLRMCKERQKNRVPNREKAPTDDCPMNGVTWYEAAEYCNWLSEKEGMDKKEWCYVPNLAGKYAEGMKMAPGYLHRKGYRLPTEAEWEYACRAGSVTSYSFGEAKELLGQYARYGPNSMGISRPVGELKPNDLGLFDMHGNNLEWALNAYQWNPANVQLDKEDEEDIKSIKNSRQRAARGGSFDSYPAALRSAASQPYLPNYSSSYFGFRPARTMQPE